MKADEPRVLAAKYGLPIGYADRIVQRHFDVVDEHAALEGGHIAGDIEMSLALSGRGQVVPTNALAPAIPAVTVPNAISGAKDDLRAQLGLS